MFKVLSACETIIKFWLLNKNVNQNYDLSIKEKKFYSIQRHKDLKWVIFQSSIFLQLSD